jgi:hypothetical protein
MVEVLSMEDGVESEGKAQLLHPARDHQLALEGSPSRDSIRAGGLRVLDGDLHIVEAELAESREPLAAEGNAAGDQVGVEIEAPCLFDDGLEVVTHEGLASREIELDHAEVLRLAHDAKPGLGVELLAMAAIVEGVGTVHAAEGTAVGQLGHQRVRPRGLAHTAAWTRPRSAMV